MIRNILVLLYVSAAWGFAFVLIKIGERTIAPITEMAGRSTIGFLALLIASLILRKDLVGHAKYIFSFIVFAILGVTVLWLAVAFGEEYITAGLTSVLVSTTPFVTFIAMVLVLRSERFRIDGLLGLLIGIAGLVLVIGFDKILGGGTTLKGVLMVMGGFAVFAINGVIAPRLASGTDPIVSTTYYLGIASLILIALSFIFESPLKTPITETNVVSELILGVVSTASGFAGYYYMLHRAGPIFSSMTFYFIPIFGVIAGMLVLGEKINASQVLGIVIVFAGVYLINRDKMKKM